jgi:hypothetical protein
MQIQADRLDDISDEDESNERRSTPDIGKIPMVKS